MYERERSWNKPAPRSPGPESHRHYSTGSPQSAVFMQGNVRTRRSSSASIHGYDDRSSMAGSSVGSRADSKYASSIDNLFTQHPFLFSA